jgi:hypothetical protein
VDWTQAGALFGLEIGVGVLAATLALARAPLGPFFFRLLGGTAAAATAAGALLPLAARDGALPAPVAAGAAMTVLACLLLAARLSWKGRALALAAALAGALLALGSAVSFAFLSGSGALGRRLLDDSTGRLFLLLAPVASGGVVGSVAVSMVLGHWYLVVPALPIELLRRMNRWAAGALAGRLALSAGILLAFGTTLRDGSLFRPMGLFHLGTRAAVGIAVPLVFSGLVAGTLRHGNTRSATGILYASCILVLIGEAVGLSLWSASGLPL